MRKEEKPRAGTALMVKKRMLSPRAMLNVTTRNCTNKDAMIINTLVAT